MQGVTLAISAIACALVLSVSPIYALVVYVVAFSLYPANLTVPVGTIDFTVLRIVIIAVYLKIFIQTDLASRFRFIWLDRFVIIYFIAQIAVGLVTAESSGAFLENRAGVIFDMALPYFAVRLIVTDRQKYVTLLKAVLVIAVPLAIVGFYQCTTGNNLVGFLKKYGVWGIANAYEQMSRLGLTRADVVFAHPIMYGLFFAMFGPTCAGIIGQVPKYKKPLYLAALGLMGVGLCSSVSSGPALAAMLSVAFLAFFRYRKYWRTAVVGVVIACALLEVVSNRHFYDVADRFSFDRESVWYRSKLIDVAIYGGGMSGHWIAGYGYKADPGWGTRIDGRPYTDMVNEYLSILSAFGLIGLVPYLAMNIAAARRLIYSYKLSSQDCDQWLVWSLAATLFGLAGAFLSVSLFGQPTTIFYMLLGFCGAMPAIIRQPGARPVPATKGAETRGSSPH